MDNLITIEEAASVLNVTRSRAVTVLKKHSAEAAKRDGTRACYRKEDIELAAHMRNVVKQNKESNKGKLSCYQCGARWFKRELRSGLCPRCLAYKAALNTGSDNKPWLNSCNKSEIMFLLDAVKELCPQALKDFFSLNPVYTYCSVY